MSHKIFACIHDTVTQRCRCIGPHEHIIVSCPQHCKQRTNDTYVGQHRAEDSE